MSNLGRLGLLAAILVVVSVSEFSTGYFYGRAEVPILQPDASDWPGDVLSEKQVNSMIERFKKDAPWHWVLIGPGDWLLAGTSYRVEVIPGGGAFKANIHLTKGYWGGSGPLYCNLACAKDVTWNRAVDDAASGITP